MKKLFITLLASVIFLTSGLPLFANEDVDFSVAENEISSVEDEIVECGLEETLTEEELAEQEEKAQERLVLVLIIIGMAVALGTLYTLKFISHRKEAKK